jgi:predicted acylesterase/phospholipase RssA
MYSAYSTVSALMGRWMMLICPTRALPVLSVPICHKHEVMIDGGLVNNIPADVLVSQRCNLVIASSVTAKMEQQFCEITPETSKMTRKRPTIVQTILRSLLVQNYNLHALGVRSADAVIEPDVTGFDLTEFVRAKELAAIGEATAREQVPKIQGLLTWLDPQLFPPSSDVSRRPEEELAVRLVKS